MPDRSYARPETLTATHRSEGDEAENGRAAVDGSGITSMVAQRVHGGEYRP